GAWDVPSRERVDPARTIRPSRPLRVEESPRLRGGARGYRRYVSDRNQRIIEEFRANEGRVGESYEGRTLLLLHHAGAKTGIERISPVAYQRLSDDSVAIFASKGGSPTNPDWFHNIVANPDVTVEIGSETFPAHARVAAGDERSEIWERQKQEWPGFA